MDGQQKFASAAERHVSTSKLVKEAYESCSSSSSSSSSTVSDSQQDVLQSLHHGDVLKHHATNTIRSRLTGTMADHEKTEKTLNKLQVWQKRLNYFLIIMSHFLTSYYKVIMNISVFTRIIKC